jgi:CRISPR/Cas system CSM-associated protein Csm2 small subunit
MANSTQEAIRIAAEGIAKLKVEMTSLNAVILDGATKLNTMLSADTTSFKELNGLLKQVEATTKKTNEASEKKIVVDGKMKTQQNQLAKEIQRANKSRLREADSIERNKNALKKQKDAVIELSRPYNKLISQHKLSKKVLQDLIVSKGKDNLLTKKAQIEYDRLTKKVNQANGATRNFAKGGLRSSARGIRNLLGAFGLIGGFQLFARAIGNTFNRVREFDKSMQNIAGVFRTTRNALKPLESTIIEVAGASIKTSREVATLAETLATLGKSPEQIQKLLKPVVDLGIGLNVSGAEAGEFLIQMLNAFGASDDEALKYADTIATIRTSTMDFQKMRDSFQYIAPISRLLNKDLAYTGAVVGILADNGLKAQQAGRVLGTSLQKLAIKGFTLTEALEQINKAQSEGVKETELLAMANSLLGAEGAKIGIVLARNSKIIEENAQAIRDNGGALDDLVNEQLKSLDAKLLILDASWERLIFSIENVK